MTEMIERVAQALALCAGGKICGPGQSVASREFGWKGDGEHFAKYVETHWQEHITAAQFAIEAMREPTLAMSEAAANTKGQMSYADVWRAMIDSALSLAQRGTER